MIEGRVVRLSSTGEIRVPVGWTMEQIEREAIRQTLAANDDNRTRSAEAPAGGLRTLHRKIKEYDLR